MNYRHAYHAGNFADVFKHVVLARILAHLTKKEAAFRVVDTHAGAGLYRLDADEAERTGEWRDGIGRLADAELPATVRELLGPYLDLVLPMMAETPPLYPGSPVIAARLTRPQDRLSLCEKHPDEARRLSTLVHRDRRVSVSAGDGFARLSGLLPPPERRGLVLIDPPYEEEHEFRAILAALEAGLKRWATGIYAVWYPIKGRREVDWFARRAAELDAAKILRGEILLYGIERIDRLNGCGMLILNPPWHLEEEMRQFAASLSHIFARDSGGHSRVEWLKAE